MSGTLQQADDDLRSLAVQELEALADMAKKLAGEVGGGMHDIRDVADIYAEARDCGKIIRKYHPELGGHFGP